MNLGAGEVYRMALLDRSGQPIHQAISEQLAEKHRRLWRWDVPDLGQRRACHLCHTLDLVAEVKQSLSHDMAKKRLKKWIEQWKPQSVADSWESSGWLPPPFPNKKMGKQRFAIYSSHPSGNDQATSVSEATSHDAQSTSDGIDENETNKNPFEIYHATSTSLAATTVEIRRITTKRTYPLDLAKKADREFTPETRLEILCTQLLLFFDEMRLHEKKDHFSCIMEQLWKAEKDSPISALAGLCMGLVDEILAEELKEAFEKYLSNNKMPILDALLALGLFRKRLTPQSTESLSRLSTENQDVPLGLYMLFSNHATEDTCLRSLFQIIGSTSREGHNSPLREILTKKDNSITSQQIMTIQIYLNGLVDALINFPSVFFRVTGAGTPDAKEHAKNISEFIRKLQNSSLHDSRTILTDIHSYLYDDSAGVMSKYWGSLCISIKSGNKISASFADIIAIIRKDASAKVASKYGQNISFLDNASKKAWLQSDGTSLREFELKLMDDKSAGMNEAIFLPSFTQICLRDVILNGIHADAQIRNPEHSESNTVAHMWYDVCLDDDKVSFKFINACKAIQEPKLDLYFDVFKRFGGTISSLTENTAIKPINYEGTPLYDRKLIEITMTIPTMNSVIRRPS